MRSFFLVVIACLNFAGGIAQNSRAGFYQTQHLAPQPDFGWSSLCLGDTTYFINETIRGGNYKWIVVADTDTVLISYRTDLAYKFDSVGYYTISLWANNGHLVSTSKTIYVDSAHFTAADFSFMHCSNHFVNMSSCASSFKWNFGDGHVATDDFPVHEYRDTGHYTVTLTAYHFPDSSVVTKKIFVDCEHFPDPSFTYRVSYDTVFVHWNDSVVHTVISWLFDGTHDIHNVRDTFIVYQDTGRYDIVFFVLTNCLYSGSDQSVHLVFTTQLNLSSSAINVVPNPVALNGEMDVYYNAERNEEAELMIINAIGEEIIRQKDYLSKGLNERKIAVSLLKSGVYNLILRTTSGTARSKFLVPEN